MQFQQIHESHMYELTRPLPHRKVFLSGLFPGLSIMWVEFVVGSGFPLPLKTNISMQMPIRSRIWAQQVNCQCVVPGKIHTHPIEGQWKFLGGGGLKAKILEAKYEAKLGKGACNTKNLPWGKYGYFLNCTCNNATVWDCWGSPLFLKQSWSLYFILTFWDIQYLQYLTSNIIIILS